MGMALYEIRNTLLGERQEGNWQREEMQRGLQGRWGTWRDADTSQGMPGALETGDEEGPFLQHLREQWPR